MGHGMEGQGAGSSPEGFRRILAAVDSSECARAALAFAEQLGGCMGADITVVELAETRARHTCRSVTPTAHRGRHLTVTGPTLGARSRELAVAIADAAAANEADVIVLCLDRRRLSAHHLAPSLRDHLARATSLPVLVTPVTAQTTDHAHAGRDDADALHLAESHQRARRYAGV